MPAQPLADGEDQIWAEPELGLGPEARTLRRAHGFEEGTSMALTAGSDLSWASHWVRDWGVIRDALQGLLDDHTGRP